ncbi:MAG: hypothetical protein HY438_01245 [DPANN group archaeon]|nr:hypothetical protein [DPANN group archaeon]
MQITTDNVKILPYVIGQILIEKEIADTFVVLAHRGVPSIVCVKRLKEYEDMPPERYLSTQIIFSPMGFSGIAEMHVTYYPRPSLAEVSDTIILPFELNKLDELADIIGKIQLTMLEKSNQSWKELQQFKRLC